MKTRILTACSDCQHNTGRTDTGRRIAVGGLVVGDPELFKPPTPSTPAGFSAPNAFSYMDTELGDYIKSSVEISAINNYYEEAYDTKEPPTFYAGYELFVRSYLSTTEILLRPSLDQPLFQSQQPHPARQRLLTAAGALYRRKRRTA